MKKFTKSLAAAGAVMLATTVLSTSASAQTSPAPKFSADTSAYCAATFGWILEFLAPNGLPEEAAIQSNLAFMMWNYELNTALGEGADDAAFKSKADGAIQKLSDNMPNKGESQEQIQQIVDYVTSEASTCGKKLESNYPSGTHPVIVALQQQAAAARAAQAATPTE